MRRKNRQKRDYVLFVGSPLEWAGVRHICGRVSAPHLFSPVDKKIYIVESVHSICSCRQEDIRNRVSALHLFLSLLKEAGIPHLPPQHAFLAHCQRTARGRVRILHLIQSTLQSAEFMHPFRPRLSQFRRVSSPNEKVNDLA